MNSIVCNFCEVIKTCFCFKGTLSREKFWSYLFTLFIPFYILAMPLFVVCATLFVNFPTRNVWTTPTTYLAIVFSLSFYFLIFVYFLMTLGPSARRLRDMGFTPWLLLLHLIKPLGLILLVLFWCFPTKKVIETSQNIEVTPKEPTQENTVENKTVVDTESVQQENTAEQSINESAQGTQNNNSQM